MSIGKTLPVGRVPAAAMEFGGTLEPSRTHWGAWTSSSVSTGRSPRPTSRHSKRCTSPGPPTWDGLARERGWNSSQSKESFLDEIENGELYVDSPEVIMTSIELYGTAVLPLVRDMLADVRG